MLDRRDVAQALVDQIAHQARVCLDLGQLGRIQRQRLECSGQGRRGGVVAGGADRHEPAVRVRGGPVLAIGTLGHRDQGGQVVARVGAPVLDQVVEVLVEGLHGLDELLGHRLGGDRDIDLLGLVLGVGVAEELLGERHDHRLVGFRDAEQRHDDVQRIAERPVVDEVDLLAAVGHRLELVDGLVGELADLAVEGLEPGRLEVVEGDVLDGGVLRRVQIRQGIHQSQAAAEELLGERVAGLVGQDRVVAAGLVAAAGGEDLGLALDLLDLLVLGDQPQIVVSLDLGQPDGHVLAHPLVGLVQGFEVGMSLGKHDPAGDVLG